MKNDLGVNDSTINTRKRALRVLINFWSSKNYMRKIQISVNNVIRYKETYTDEEVAMLLKYDESIFSSFVHLRNWVITNYFLGTGNRLRTVRNIKTSDVDLKNKNVFLRAMKNAEPQNLPLCSTLAVILEEYIKVRKNLPRRISILYCQWTAVIKARIATSSCIL